MKRIIFSMLAMVAMVSCSSEEGINPDDNTPVEIKLNAGVNTVTKAIVTTENLSKAYFANGNETNVYTTTPWTANIANGKITFDPAQYYPGDNSSIYIKGFAPEGIYKEGVVSYTITGDEDIIVSEEINGSKNTPMTEVAFGHLLTQLQFEVVAANSDVTTAWGILSSIELTEQPTALELDLSKNELAKATIPVLTSLTTKGYTAAAIPTTATSAGYIMILPEQTSIPLKITTIDGGVKTVTAQLAGGVATAKGKAHKITLTFAAEVTATATVTEWGIDGAGGNVDIK